MGSGWLGKGTATLLLCASLLPAPTAATVGGPAEWPHYAGGPHRHFFNPDEHLINTETARRLRVKWRYRAGAIITSSPAVAVVDLPGTGPTQVAFFSSWDSVVHAVRVADGTRVWSFRADLHPAATFPAASSADVSRVGDRLQVHIGVGEVMYALDARTGTELWRFTAGTGCRGPDGRPPGLCGYGDGEQNQIESSALVAEGRVFFGMDVDDDAVGKGGWYALDAQDGRLAWFLDLQSGRTCRPAGDDVVRRFDGFHSETELGLPTGFLASRPGCDFPRERTGCENVWSSAAWDSGRRTMYFATSNCDLDDPESTLFGDAAMPPLDEALVAVHADGTPVWRWRPREVDNGDLAFGAAPNLFTIRRHGRAIEVVGVGNKDGTYTVVDRDGHNESDGTSWTDRDAATALPYWQARPVIGGDYGGVIATAAVDEARRRVLFSTAAGDGDDLFEPQQPTVHALDADTGQIVWQNLDPPGLTFDSSYAPTSAVDGVMFVGSTITSNLRVYATGTGELLSQRIVGDGLVSAVASGAAVVDGTVLVGTGVGARHGDPFDIAEISSRLPSSLVALCVTGVDGCPETTPGRPREVRATADADGTVTVHWEPTGDDGGSPLTGQLVVASGHGGTRRVDAAATSVNFQGLVASKPYTFTVSAENAHGVGQASLPSAPVAPEGEGPRCGGEAATVIGSPVSEVLSGSPTRDVFVGLGGADWVFGLGGDDVVCGNGGGDVLVGGPGADLLEGGAGNDLLVGDSGRDTADGGSGFDLAFGAEVLRGVP